MSETRMKQLISRFEEKQLKSNSNRNIVDNALKPKTNYERIIEDKGKMIEVSYETFLSFKEFYKKFKNLNSLPLHSDICCPFCEYKRFDTTIYAVNKKWYDLYFTRKKNRR